MGFSPLLKIIMPLKGRADGIIQLTLFLRRWVRHLHGKIRLCPRCDTKTEGAHRTLPNTLEHSLLSGGREGILFSLMSVVTGQGIQERDNCSRKLSHEPLRGPRWLPRVPWSDIFLSFLFLFFFWRRECYSCSHFLSTSRQAELTKGGVIVPRAVADFGYIYFPQTGYNTHPTLSRWLMQQSCFSPSLSLCRATEWCEWKCIRLKGEFCFLFFSEVFAKAEMECINN